MANKSFFQDAIFMRILLAISLAILCVGSAFAGAGIGSANLASKSAWTPQTNGDRIFDGADFSMEIAREPDRASARFYRGQAERRQGDLARAEADIEEAARLDPGLTTNTASEFVALGYLRFQRQEWTNALSDFIAASVLNPPDGRAHVGMWLCSSRLGDIQTANTQLQAYLVGSAGNTNQWIFNIARFLMGQVTEADFLNAAKADGDKHNRRYCEACFYAASKYLLTGDKAAAVAYFKKCLSTRVKHSMEYKNAKAELRILNN